MNIITMYGRQTLKSISNILFYLTIFLACISSSVYAIERIHFLIPGGAGGGWDTTARGTGEALTRAGLVPKTSYENKSGGDGSKAIAHLIETASRQSNTLLVTSTPIVLRSLKNLFPQSYKDLTPVATTIADYGAFVVKNNSPYKNWQQIIDDFKKDPRNVKVAGGSVRGGMDHIVAALAFKKSGVNAKTLRYIPYNAGAKAMVGLLSEETQMLSTGLSEALALAEQGEVRILAMTAAERLDYAPNTPTVVEQGADMTFTNWRGFFAAPNLPNSKVQEFQTLLEKMYDSPEWEEIRQKRGWSNLYIAGVDFVKFLQEQEKEMSLLMNEIGILVQ